MATTLVKSLRGDTVARLRLRDVCAVEPAAPVEQVVRTMARLRTGCSLVLRDGRIAGSSPSGISSTGWWPPGWTLRRRWSAS